MFRRSSSAVANSREGQLAARLLLLRVLGQLVVDGPHIADRTATLVLRAARPDPCLDVAVQLKEHSPSIAVVLPVDVHALPPATPDLCLQIKMWRGEVSKMIDRPYGRDTGAMLC